MSVMSRLRPAALAALALSCGALLAACGSGTSTVTVASAPPDTASTAATQTEATSTASTAASTPMTTTTATTPATTTTARTAPEPAFTEQETHAQGLPGALATVRSLGYTPQDASDYHSGQTLRVLIGTRSSSGSGQLAFFFVGNHYIGTDVRVPSASISVAGQSEAEVTIAYALYRNGNPAGRQSVSFQLNNGKLQAMDPIPPALSATGTSRN